MKEKYYWWRWLSSGRQWLDQHHRQSRSNNAEEEVGAAELACSVPASRKMDRRMTRSSWGRPCPESNRLLREMNSNPVMRTMVGSWFRDKQKNNAHVTQDKDTKKGAQETQIDLEHNLSVVS